MINNIANMPLFWLMLLGLSAISLIFLLLPLLKSKSTPTYFYLLFIPLFMGATLLLYLQWGGSTGLLEKHALDELKIEIAEITKDPNIARADAMAKFEALEHKIAYSPFALTQMASVYNQLGLFDEALRALETALKLSTEVSIQEQWIYTHSLKNQGKLSAQIRAQAQSLVQKHANQHVLMNLLAIDDYFQGNYEQAAKGWELLLASDQDLPEEKKQVIESALHKARSLMPKTAGDSPTLAVKVKLSTRLLSQIVGNETVFVFVKQSGEAMPLAVLKKRVTDLPLTVDFDSKHSMIAGKSLSVGMKVEVVAKLSKTGDPLDKRGELSISSQHFILKSVNEPIEIEIN